MRLVRNKTHIDIHRNSHYTCIITCVIIVIVLSLAIGVEDFHFSTLFSEKSRGFETLVISRTPRTITLLLTGAGLSICGIIIQQITQNKFISPTTAGTLDAAKLGTLFSMIVFSQQSFLIKLIFAVAFCLFFTGIFTFSISKIIKQNTVIVPVLGVMYGYMLSAITNVIGVQFNIVQNIESWMVGNFAKSIKGQYETIYILVPLLMFCYIYARKFTVAGFGKDFARNIGLNYQVIVSTGLILTSIMVSISILTVGSLPFVDLIIPNLITIFYGDNIHRNIPFIASYGGLSIALCDIVGRLIIYPYEIPCSLVVGSIGALIFLIVLFRKNR